MLAVTAALLQDAEAADRAAVAAAPVTRCWADAARDGLTHPGLAAAARGCFAAALDALPRVGADAGTVAAVAAWQDRYVSRGRCPADDRLDAWARGEPVFPIEPELEASWT